MSVIEISKDPRALTMTVVCEFDAPVEKVWRLWEDPRLLEKWWGPPTYPATFDEYDFTPGGMARYHMTGPEGDQPRGWWRITKVEAPYRLEFADGFADEAGNPSRDFPEGTVRVEIAVAGVKTRMTVISSFASAEVMEQLLAMGQEEGMREAMGQIDGVLAAA